MFFGVFMLTLSLASAFSGGSGSVEDPFLVSTCEELQSIGDMVNIDKGYYFAQVNDIDCLDTVNWNDGAGFVPIGRNNPAGFQGRYNGQDYAIFDLYINRPIETQTGLFSFMDFGYFVTKVNLVEATIYGEDKTGGILGLTNGVISYSTVENSYINSDNEGAVGAIAGNVYNSGQVIYCRNVNTQIVGSWMNGGLVGYNSGEISNSYSTGSVSGTDYTGGLVGDNEGVITNSYSTGSVSGISFIGGLVGHQNSGSCSNSFWDVETSGQETSACGTGKTTNEMKTLSTFTNEGWDFENIWQMCSEINEGYPSLKVFGVCAVPYEWSGFLKPVDNLPMLNLVKAGSAVPIKFSLNGDKGLDIFDSNPVSCWTSCDSSLIGDVIEETSTAGQSTLSYNPLIDEYTYVWKTEKYWKGSCRKFTLNLNDGTSHSASFEFK